MNASHLDVRHVPPFLDALSQLCEQTGAFVSSYGSQPADGSLAIKEHAGYSEPRAIQAAWSIANLLIDYAANHVDAFMKIAREPINIEASWTCIRSMLESCSIGAWIVDPAIAAHERAGRTYAYRYEGYAQQLKLAECLADKGKASVIAGKIDAMEKQALASGFAPRTNKKGNRCGIGDHMPSATDVIKLMLDDEMFYRILSAIAHGHHWALAQMYKTVDDGRPRDDTMVLLQKGVDVEMIMAPGSKGMIAFARLLWNQSHYCGWNTLRLEEIYEDAADGMTLPEAHRFWRS